MLKEKLHNYIYILEPSPLSLTICLIISILTWVGSYSSYLHSIFHTSNITFQRYSYWQKVSNFWRDIISSSTANTLTIWILWLTVGLIVYLVTYFFVTNIQGFEEAIEEKNYIWPKNADPEGPMKEFAKRSAVRLVILIIFIIYAKFTLSFILSHSNIGLVLLSRIFVFIGELLLLHLGVVLFRLFALKARIFPET